MKKIFFLLLLIVILSFSAQAKINFWGCNAEIWNKFEEPGGKIIKTAYIQGVFDGLELNSEKGIHSNYNISTDISVEQYVLALDVLCADYKNSLIPVVFLLKIVTMEIEGAEKDTVEDKIIELRKIMSGSK